MPNIKTGSYKKCLNCDKDIWTHSAGFKRKKYCSVICVRLHKKAKDLICKYCNKHYLIQKSRVKNSRFCSRLCAVKNLTPHKQNQTTRKKISQTLKKIGHKPPYRKGHKLTLEHRKNLSIARMGKNAPGWRGGITKEHLKIRGSLEYREWRKAVFERDNYTCLMCGERGGKLNADHIKPFAYYPDLRFEMTNGRTLCIECHKQTNTYGVSAIRRIYATI